MNKVYLEGNIGKVQFDNKKEDSSAFIVISLGSNRKYYDKANNPVTLTTWLKVVLVGQIASFLRDDLKVGTKLVVEGTLENNNYKDKDGKEVYEVNIKATRVLKVV